MEKIINQTKKLYVVIDKVSQEPRIFDIALNDQDFIRNNMNLIMSTFQFKDIETYCLGDLIDVTLNALNSKSHKVDFSTYSFDTESENLMKSGMSKEDVESYFAERAKKNRGITEKQIIQIIDNYISKKKE